MRGHGGTCEETLYEGRGRGSRVGSHGGGRDVRSPLWLAALVTSRL